MSTPPPIVPPVPTSTTSAPSSSPVPREATGAEAASSILFFAILSAALLTLAWRLGWFRRDVARWSSPRCPTPASAGRLWVGLGTMVMTFAIAAALFAGRPADAGPPTVDRAAAALAAMSTIYLVGLVLVTIIHGAMGLEPALSSLGLRRVPWAASTSGGAAGVVDGPLDYATPVVGRIRDGWVVAIGAPFAIAATFGASAVTQVVWTWIGYEHASAHQLLQVMRLVRESPVVLGVAILNAAVLAPLFEEILFRGHLQTALTSLFPRRWPAIVITSLLFAAMHERWMMPPIFVLSLILGYLYERTGNLWVSIATHAAFNATSTALFLISRGRM